MKTQFCNIIKKGKPVRGFVLPFTVFLVSIMIIVTTNVSSILTRQLFFSKVSRQSQTAYYAADNALACAITMDDTYVDQNTGQGIFPYDTGGNNPLPLPLTTVSSNPDIQAALTDVNTRRASDSLPPLTLNDIKCAQNSVFNTDSTKEAYTISSIPATVTISPGVTEEAVVSSFKMKMPIGDGSYRCAKVSVIKSTTYRQIIAQGYALCDRPDGAVERAVVNTTIK